MPLFARSNQPLADHLLNVSKYAAEFGGKCKISEITRLCGFFHDLGKSTPEFQEYLATENAVRGSVRHSVFGAKRAYEDIGELPEAAEIIANVIAAHHGALYDHLAADGETPLLDRLNDTECLENPNYTIDFAEIKRSIADILAKFDDEEKWFALSMITKFAYSALVDADRLDAYLFETKTTFDDISPDWGVLSENLGNYLSSMESEKNSEIRSFRSKISKKCLEAGERKIGIYKLEVPTGGGKTLSSLRFAIKHAEKHRLNRIIYVVPYLSILSQTANSIRNALSVDDKIVLEHHSDFAVNDYENYNLHTDRWDMSIILTTQVQFLESVFSAKARDLRKLHNMANSVIIFDEVQSLPIKCVNLFNSAVNFLHKACNSTILLCTATQPLLDRTSRPLKFSENPSLVECDVLRKRVNIVNSLKQSGYSYEELADFVSEKHNSSILIIVNTKAAAKSLYNAIKSENKRHLSTNMCAAHRDKIIGEVRDRLDEKKPIICVSTQLIEAGVDISFECVIRDIAGLDSIYQAAGRCNRHGEYDEPKNVYVINISEENLGKLPDIKCGAETTRRLFDEENAENLDEFYRYYFHDRRGKMDYPTQNYGSLYELLAGNPRGCANYKKTDKKSMLSALRTAANEFYVIDKGRIEVVVDFDEAIELLDDYVRSFSPIERRKILRKLSKYSVSLYSYQLNLLEEKGALYNVDNFRVLTKGFYDSEIGVNLEGSQEFLYV